MSTALYPLASLSQIERTPSREDAIPADLEEDLRAYGCKLIQQAGVLLKQYVYYYQRLSSDSLTFQKTSSNGHCTNPFPALLVYLIHEEFWYRSKLFHFNVRIQHNL